jgi:dimethylargininase
MIIAVTRPVSPSLGECELTHLAREPIDVARASEQHAAYEDVLRLIGATIVRAPAAPAFPDAVFIEDTAVVLDKVAVITRPGAPSRQGETEAVAALMAEYRHVVSMKAPATLDGGDVLLLGRTLYVGLSGRTSTDGIAQLASLVAPFRYSVVPVEFHGCLHLKSAVTAVDEGVLLMNPAWVSASVFPRYDALSIDPREPYAANALRLGGVVVYPSQYPFTRDLLVQRGLCVATTDCSELAKAEGAVTCCSLVFEHNLESATILLDHASEAREDARTGGAVRFEEPEE